MGDDRYDDQKAVQEAEEKRRLQREEEMNDIRAIIEKPEGLRLFRRLLEVSFIFRTTFTNNGWSAFNEGQRNIGLMFLRDIVSAAPEYLEQLMFGQIESLQKEEKK